MGSSEKFCLKWNDFQTNISSSFQDLRKDQDFSDVTLTCDGDTRIEAHRVILAGSSKFFSRVLKQQQHPHPLLYMRGMTTVELSAVMDFIYHGEVSVFQEDIADFLAVAAELQLKGLNEMDTRYKDPRPEYKPLQARRIMTTHSQGQVPDSDSHSNIWQKTDQKPEPENDIETSIVSNNYEELDATIKSMMEKNADGKWVCRVCGKIENRQHMTNHIEGKHIDGISHPCEDCGKTLRSRHSLANHVWKFHKM
jgi:hypothetical protein